MPFRGRVCRHEACTRPGVLHPRPASDLHSTEDAMGKFRGLMDDDAMDPQRPPPVDRVRYTVSPSTTTG